jgi:hypothetical protein
MKGRYKEEDFANEGNGRTIVVLFVIKESWREILAGKQLSI